MSLSRKNLVLRAMLFTVVPSFFSISSITVKAEESMAGQQYASKQRATVAKAHMSRARALLVEALEEFEESKKYARPDLLIDSEDWRLRVVSLTEQLNRVIDPKPRVTREGAVFRVPPRFMRREKERLPVVAEGAKSRSDVGERARLAAKTSKRESLFGGDANSSNIQELGQTQGQSGRGDKNTSKISKGLEIPKELAVPVDADFEQADQSGEVAVEAKSGKGSSRAMPTEVLPGDEPAFSDDLLPSVEEKSKKVNDAKLIENKQILQEIPSDMTVKSPKELSLEGEIDSNIDSTLKDSKSEAVNAAENDEILSDELSKRIQNKIADKKVDNTLETSRETAAKVEAQTANAKKVLEGSERANAGDKILEPDFSEELGTEN